MNLTGNLLIAPPSMKGNFWQKTVIYITEHHSNGSVGLVLNKKSQTTIKEFGKQANLHLDMSGYMYIGGPVNTKAMTMLHSAEWSCDNTLPINDEFSLSSSVDILTQMAMGNCPKRWRLFVGLCGWTPGQLEKEVKGKHPYNHSHSWLISSADHNIVFGYDGQQQWSESVERSGQEFVQNILADF